MATPGRPTLGPAPAEPTGPRLSGSAPARACAADWLDPDRARRPEVPGGGDFRPLRVTVTAGRLEAVNLTAALPGLARLKGYRRAWLRGDVVAGVTVAAYLVPQVMAYAEVAGLPPSAGLWASVGPLAVYAVLGSSRQLSVGPESTTALMTAAVLAPLAAGDTAHYAALAATLAIMVGCLCLAAGLVRLGVVADLLSKPVLTGYMAGIAVLMIVGQLGKVSGIPVDGEGFADELVSFFTQLDLLRWPTLALAVAVLVVLYVLERFVPWVPGPLAAMALATAAVAVLAPAGFDLVGPLPAGLPPAVTGVSAADVGELILPAAGIAIVGFSDNVLTARAFAARRGEEIDADQELRALAAANASAGLLHGFPVSSSGSRTALGVAVGARTQLHSLVALATVVLAVFFARPLLAVFPKAALGALVVFAAAHLVDFRELRRFALFRRSEIVLALLTIAGVLGLGVLYGVLAAVGLSVLDLLRRIARRTTASSAQCPGSPGCTTSTTTRRQRPRPAWSSTATTRRCASPTRKISAGGRSPRRPGTVRGRRSGSCSTRRRTSKSTSPPPTPSTGSGRSSAGGGWCSRWRG